MNLKQLRERIFRNLFRREYLTMQFLQSETMGRKSQIGRLMQEKEELRRAQPVVHPKPSNADLMRESLGLMMVDFASTEQNGLPKHFLDIEDIPKRTLYISQLNEIWRSEAWHAMVEYYLNGQGNYTIRNAPNDSTALLTCRAAINAIGELRIEVERAHAEFTERTRPPEDFDRFSVELLSERS